MSEVVTITGTSFGSHPDNDKYNGGAKDQDGLMYVYDNFDSSSYSTLTPGIGYEGYVQTLFDASADMPLTDTGINKVNSRLCWPVPNYENSNGCGVNPSSTNDGYFTSFWYRVFENTTYDSNAQMKMVRLKSGNYPNCIWEKQEFTASRQHQLVIETLGTLRENNFNGSYNTVYDDGSWHYIESWLKASSAVGNADGELYMRIDGDVVYDITNAETWDDSDNDNSFDGRWWVVGFVRGFNPPSETEFPTYIDDVYFDYTQARVILCDASTLNSGTKFQIQVPTEWTTTSVTLSFEPGTFTDGETAYLILIDSDGNESVGYQVVVGEPGPTQSTDTVRVLPVGRRITRRIGG